MKLEFITVSPVILSPRIEKALYKGIDFKEVVDNTKNLKIEKEIINEKELFQIVCAYRLFLPFANITISTRENSIFRDNIIKIAATKISAGVDTGIGAHTKCSTKKGDEQFEIADKRTVAQIFEKIKSEELQPVMNDYIYLKD